MTDSACKKLFELSVAASTAALVLLFLLVPAVRPTMAAEDHALETVTVYVFLGVAAIALFGACTGRGSASRGMHLLLLGLALFCALEELSWGERHLGLTAPRVLDYKIDSAHDLLFLAVKVVFHAAHKWGAIVWIACGAGAALCGWLLWAIRAALRERLARLLAEPALYFVVFFVGLGLLALVVDTVIVFLPAGIVKELGQLAEELLEVHAALALAFGALQAIEPRRPEVALDAGGEA